MTTKGVIAGSRPRAPDGYINCFDPWASRSSLTARKNSFEFGSHSRTTGCASGDPLDEGSADGGTSETIVVGSQDVYSSEIIAELYAQALEENGYTVDRQFRIGQREGYIPEIEGGGIDVFLEYTGNLLQYYVPDTEAFNSLL